MVSVEPLGPAHLDEIVARVVREQRRVNERHPLIDARVDARQLADSLRSSAPDTVVALRDGRVVGHLRGTLLASDVYGHGAWMNPEGLSYDDATVLEDLYVALANRWLAVGADRHYVWVPRDESVAPWLLLGFAYMHQRGTRVLAAVDPVALPTGYHLRRGGIDDLEIALALDEHLREFQETGPSYAFGLANTGQREDWIETLEDPEVTYVIVERDGVPVAQCSTFPVPERVGSFARTIHLSAVVVRHEHRRLGVARAMVDAVLHDARRDGFVYAETNWRVTNRRAERYWMTYGFTPTYVRLHRHVGVG